MAARSVEKGFVGRVGRFMGGSVRLVCGHGAASGAGVATVTMHETVGLRTRHTGNRADLC
jgi:hypothetical protein